MHKNNASILKKNERRNKKATAPRKERGGFFLVVRGYFKFP